VGILVDAGDQSGRCSSRCKQVKIAEEAARESKEKIRRAAEMNYS
jgi:hypothetical protein